MITKEWRLKVHEYPEVPDSTKVCRVLAHMDCDGQMFWDVITFRYGVYYPGDFFENFDTIKVLEWAMLEEPKD